MDEMLPGSAYYIVRRESASGTVITLPETALMETATTKVMVVPPVVVGLIITIAQRFLENSVDKFFSWMFNSGDKQDGVTLPQIAELMQQFCQYVCSFVYQTVNDARIKSKLDHAKELLDTINQKLRRAANTEDSVKTYEELYFNALLSQAMSAYKSLSEEASQVAILNYATIATAEIQVMRALIQADHKDPSRRTLADAVKEHKEYLIQSIEALKIVTCKSQRVGALPNAETNCAIYMPHPTATKDEPNSPENLDYDNTVCGQRYRQRYYILLTREEVDPWQPTGWKLLDQQQVILDALVNPGNPPPPQPPINVQIQGYLAAFRQRQKTDTDKKLKDLEDGLFSQIRVLMDAWDKALGHHKHKGNEEV